MFSTIAPTQLSDRLLTVPPIKPRAEPLLQQLLTQLGPGPQPLHCFVDDTAVSQLADQFIACTTHGDHSVAWLARHCLQSSKPIPAPLTDTGLPAFIHAATLPPVPRVDHDPHLRQTAALLATARRLAQLQARFFAERPQLPLPFVNIRQPASIMAEVDNFLQRINREWFPIDIEVDCYPDDELCWPLEYVPLMPHGVCYERDLYGLWGESGYGEAEPLEMLMHLAVSELFGGYWYDVEELPSFTTAYPDLSPLPADCTLRSLLPVLARLDLPQPLCHLTNALRIVLKCSGTFWLDVSYEEYVEGWQPLLWDDMAPLLTLRDEWVAAQKIQAGVDTLIAWCKEGNTPLISKLGEILALLHHAFQCSQGQLPLPLSHFTTTIRIPS